MVWGYYKGTWGLQIPKFASVGNNCICPQIQCGIVFLHRNEAAIFAHHASVFQRVIGLLLREFLVPGLLYNGIFAECSLYTADAAADVSCN